jgi:CubicO group peptidase (beta-lactamase class C family)
MNLARRSFLAGLLASPALAQQPGEGFAPRPRPAAAWTRSVDGARSHERLHALVIVHRGQPVVAEAFRGPGVERPANVKSVSKSIVAALLGAAVDRGEVSGVGATLGDIAPDLIPAGVDARVPGITVEDLVTMQAGLERTSGAGYGAWVSSRDWVGYALERPLVAEPGGRMLYSTGSFHVLGAVLAEVTGESLLAQARERLGDPLDIDIPAWTRDPQGYYLGGNEMALSPVAMARFGEMLRGGGAWQGRQVLSRAWVAESLTPRTRSPFSGLDYGYGWFLGRAGRHRMALARGYGGQLIAVVPSAELTVAITSDPTLPARSEGYFGDLVRLVSRTIVQEAEVV